MDNREIDARIAKEFMGWSRTEDDWWIDANGNFQEFVAEFHPSYDPKANALVLDEIERRNWNWEMEWYPIAGYRFSLWPDKIHRRTAISDNRYMAVCLAALQAAESILSEE